MLGSTLMGDADRRQRAEARRARATLSRGTLERHERDLDPIHGEDAVSLVTVLTRESWSEAGLEIPTYPRSRAPIRFVPRQ